MSRLEEWKKPKRLLTLLSGGREEVIELFKKHWKQTNNDESGTPRMTTSDVIGAAKELIFELRNGLPYFHVIMYGFDTDSLAIQVEPVLEMLTPEDHSQETLSDHMRNILAIAAMEGVPVYPNTEAEEVDFIKHYRDMLILGFTAPDGAGGRIPLRLKKSPGREIESIQYLEKLQISDTHSPADFALIRQVVRAELQRRDEAGRVLASLRLAISELSGILTSKVRNKVRNEGNLQNCLTRNPILFGAEYVEIIPKHRLGAEFEMDYALKRVSGLIDLVEIEASSHPLFTVAGNPTHQLVHAEQQVMDWIQWIDKHGAYARERLPSLISPIGYVVIGRRASLSQTDQERLSRRNIIFNGRIGILTYDDLLDRAKTLLDRLTGKRSVSAETDI